MLVLGTLELISSGLGTNEADVPDSPGIAVRVVTELSSEMAERVTCDVVFSSSCE